MTPFQNLWVTVWNFGPAIIIGIYKEWWMGLIALFASWVLSFLIGWVTIFALPPSANALLVSGYLKTPVIAALLLFVAFRL